jgi:hypothetical protein
MICLVADKSQSYGPTYFIVFPHGPLRYQPTDPVYLIK